MYGATANDWFFLQDSRLSEGITLTGQCMVRYAGDGIDKWYQELFGCNSRFYTDTDSVLFSLDEIVKKYMSGVEDKTKITNGLIKVIDAKIQPILNASMASLSDYLNLDATRLSFKREFVADRALMIAKKMYMTRVYNNEGVEYPEGDLKIMGITVVRSSTPQIVRTHLTDMLPMLLDEDIGKIQNHIEKTREIYMNAKPEEIAFPRGVKDIAKWETPTGPKKGCPIHVRASIVHNMMVKDKKLENDVPNINPGDKMKFVYTVLPNPTKNNVIGFIDKLPSEFKMEPYIDYGTMWEKSFMKPVEDFLSAAGVVIPDAADITSFFG